MTDKNKKVAAIAAVSLYIKSEQEAAAVARSVGSECATSGSGLSEQPPLVLNLWGISGRQQQMQMRSMMQMKSFHLSKHRF